MSERSRQQKSPYLKGDTKDFLEYLLLLQFPNSDIATLPSSSNNLSHHPLDSEQINLIWNEYQEQREWQRHNEAQRAQLAQVLLAITAALIAILSDNPTPKNWPIPIFIILIGIFGFLAILKYWERFIYHSQLERIYRYILDSHFSANLSRIEQIDITKESTSLFTRARSHAKYIHEHGRYPLLKDRYFRQHWLWEGVFLIICLLGVFLLIYIQ